ncbi:MAG TPA: NAD-dependent epimerase/dehydratase family protein [Egibacteraceae bacterium]
MKIVLFGAGGFIGSHLVEHLAARAEHDIVAVDVSDDKLAGIPPTAYRFHRADIRSDRDLVDELIAEADLVVDLVAYANPSIYVEAPLEVVDLNFVANLDIVERCVRHRRRLIQYSSCEVYGKFSGREGDRVDEEADLVYGPVSKHRWIYASAKQLLERIIHAHGLAGQLEFTILRPFNFIGPRLDYLVPPGTRGGPRVFAHFMSALLSGGPLQLVEGGTARRSFLHIADATAAFQAVLDDPDGSRNAIFNVGNPDNDTSIRGLAEVMLDVYWELTGEEPTSELVTVAAEDFYGAGYDDDGRLPPDITRLSALGWKPQRDLRTTVRETMAYYLGEHAAGRLSVPALPVR